MTPAVHAQCVGEDDPIYALICIQEPHVCPLTEAWVEPDATDPQGTTVVVRVPDSTLNAVGVKVTLYTSAWTPDPPSHHYQKIWEHLSTEDAPAEGWPPGTEIRVGVPGLLENAINDLKMNDFKVSVKWSDGSFSCPSVMQWISTPDFPSQATPSMEIGPPLPAGTTMKVWDTFERPTTTTRGYGQPWLPHGDGLGPLKVYTPSDALANTPGGEADLTIWEWATGQGYALGEWTSYFWYERQVETHQHSFAQMLVRVNRASLQNPLWKYNLQVQARVGPPYLQPPYQQWVIPSYSAKLILGARGCTSPAIILFRHDEYGTANCLPDGGLHVNPDVGGVICDGSPERKVPPLDLPDPVLNAQLPDQTPKGAPAEASLPVWLRIEVDNDYQGRPVIRGSAWWWVDPDPNVTGDEHWDFCAAERTDTDEQRLLYLGKWGASFHDAEYFGDVFAAGDGSQ
ncbi:MAG: hypothetical protein KBD01_06630 [Acidobacteria bacterium]|nr:hypothetical protein [Acidobacteriota bacterium]